VPVHIPDGSGSQPGVVAHLPSEPNSVQVYDGVPAQWGPVVKRCVAAGARTSADLQQIRASGDVQSALVSHSLGQLREQTPLQQISPSVVSHSDERLHVVGQGS
jgi:hypothetical protein